MWLEGSSLFEEDSWLAAVDGCGGDGDGDGDGDGAADDAVAGTAEVAVAGTDGHHSGDVAVVVHETDHDFPNVN